MARKRARQCICKQGKPSSYHACTASLLACNCSLSFSDAIQADRQECCTLLQVLLPRLLVVKLSCIFRAQMQSKHVQPQIAEVNPQYISVKCSYAQQSHDSCFILPSIMHYQERACTCSRIKTPPFEPNVTDHASAHVR